MIPQSKHNPANWTKFQEGLCASCIGSCCRIPVEVRFEDLIRLGIVSEDAKENDGERAVAKQLKKDGVIKSYREASGLFMLQDKSDGSCRYLENNACTCYERRPDVCRNFPERIGNKLGYCPFIKK